MRVPKPNPSVFFNQFQAKDPVLYPLKISENLGFLIFSGNIKSKQWPEMGLVFPRWSETLSEFYPTKTLLIPIKKLLMSARNLLIWSFCEIKVFKKQYFVKLRKLKKINISNKEIKNNLQKPYLNSTDSIFVHSSLINYQKIKFYFVY